MKTLIQCDFCPDTMPPNETKAMAEHEDRCWSNPKNKDCGSCFHFQPFDQWEPTHVCKKGLDDGCSELENLPCPGWGKKINFE